MKIQELIVVEGASDVAAVKNAVEAEVLAVHGFAAGSKKTLEKIRFAYEKVGVILLTDPDHAGETIRKTIEKVVPGIKHAYISRADATKKDNIGVENASPRAIRAALKKARYKEMEERHEFDLAAMDHYGLNGSPGSRKRREKAGQSLGIGYGNAQQFMARLNHYGIGREELEKALKSR